MWEEVTLNTCVQIREQKASGQADIHTPTAAAMTRQTENKKQCLLLYVWLSQLKHGFFLFPI